MIDLGALPENAAQRGALIEVADAARRVKLAEVELDQQRLRLAAAIEAAHGERLSLAQIARLAGLTRGRIHQIVSQRPASGA